MRGIEVGMKGIELQLKKTKLKFIKANFLFLLNLKKKKEIRIVIKC